MRVFGVVLVGLFLTLEFVNGVVCGHGGVVVFAVVVRPMIVLRLRLRSPTGAVANISSLRIRLPTRISITQIRGTFDCTSTMDTATIAELILRGRDADHGSLRGSRSY